MTFKICVAQLNVVVGDLEGNARQLIDAARRAHAGGAQVLLSPELALCGYAAEDLYLRPSFVQAAEDALAHVVRETADLQGLHLVIGHPRWVPDRVHGSRSVSHAPCWNMASVWCEGREVLAYAKQQLPNYQVFDERRYFQPGQGSGVFDLALPDGTVARLGVLICEDAWFDEPVRQARSAGAELLLVLNASPYHLGKGDEREQAMQARVQGHGVPMVHAHLVGGQDEIVFEGRSFAVDAQGQLSARAPLFQAADLWLDCESAALPEVGHSVWTPRGQISLGHTREEDLWHALVLGVRDYVGKNGFPGVVLGLSGGIDSALVLAIAVDALGPERVRAVMMPSPYTADISWIDARDMAARLRVRYDEIDIRPEFEAFLGSLQPLFEQRPADTTEENLQARIRGTLLMALSNKWGPLVLTTGNKSEMATGYCTLYGDMAGGFAVIKDVLKTDVFRLARWRNAHDPYGQGHDPIPVRIIERPPSAELRPDQTDQDSLPPYEVLDHIIQCYMEDNQEPERLVAEGVDVQAVSQVVRLIRLNEYKRRQAPVGIRVSHRSFGKDWRYPNTNRYRG